MLPTDLGASQAPAYPEYSFLQKQKTYFSPELVISVSHLVSSEFRHKDFDNSDEYEEVNLKREGKFNNGKQIWKIYSADFMRTYFVLLFL